MMTKNVFVLKNEIQEYSWGSPTAIPELLGRPATGAPQAELWMGAHPKAPSKIEMDGGWMPLDRAVERFSEALLGSRVTAMFGGRLPFLFKVLAAASPLSIQAHPNLAQAAQGFEAENLAGIALDAPERNYRDSNHKPECICALTPFWGLCGFRDPLEIAALLERLCPETLAADIHLLRNSPPAMALETLFRHLLTLPSAKTRIVLSEGFAHARTRRHEDPVYRWITRLHDAFPDDIGALSPALLNLFCLQPGEALFLQAQELHAYLDGTGIELMANSDNVLRGGLTEKHVDVDALMAVLRFEPRSLEVLTPRQVSAHESVYTTGAREFLLSVISLEDHAHGIPMVNSGVEILLCTEGDIHLDVDGDGGRRRTTMGKGGAVLVPAAVRQYALSGCGKLYKAAVPG